jgi:protein-disulfide isomerase
MVNRTVWLAGVGGLLLGAGAMALAGIYAGARSDRAGVERIVREYILANPEILPEAMQRLQDRQLATAVDGNRQAIEAPFGNAWAGAADGDVVLVEFYDYACGFCRKSVADIDRLLAEDPKLKVVWRELPVLGPDSEAAARISLAAARQGRFRQFHDRLFAAGRPTGEAVAAAARATGVAPAAAAPEIQAEIERNYELARLVGATGTPTFVVGDKVLQGAVGYDALKEAIAKARVG